MFGIILLKYIIRHGKIFIWNTVYKVCLSSRKGGDANDIFYISRPYWVWRFDHWTYYLNYFNYKY